MKLVRLLRVAVGVATFAGVGQLGAAAIGHASDGERAPAGHSQARRSLAAAESCEADEATDTGASEVLTRGPAEQHVTVTVPATVFLHRPLGGPLLVAVTNTGCPPRADDDLWRVGPRRQYSRVAWPSIQRLTWFAVPGAPDTYVALPGTRAHPGT